MENLYLLTKMETNHASVQYMGLSGIWPPASTIEKLSCLRSYNYILQDHRQGPRDNEHILNCYR